jgi:hypothetical protein
MRFFKLLTPSGIDSTETIPCETLFRSELILGRGGGGEEDPRTNSIQALKINIVWDMADSIPSWFLLNSKNRLFPS